MKKLCTFGFIFLISLSISGGDEPDIPGQPFFKAPFNDRRKDPTAQSFMFYRPIFQNISMQQSSYWHDAIFEKIGCMKFSTQVIPMHQHSFATHPSARYFLLNHKSTISVLGDNSFPTMIDGEMVTTASCRDVRAEWLQLPSDFGGNFSIDPQQKQTGVWIEFNQDLEKLFGSDFFEPFWFAAACAFQEVKNNLRPTEVLATGSATTAPHTIIQALNRTTMLFGKVPVGTRSKKSFAEIHLKLGTRFMARDGFQIGMTNSLVLPTSNHQRAEYMFDPFLGHNRHFGFGTAVQFQFPLNRDVECKLVALYFIIENLYFLRNFQYRTLDIRQRPWTRYLLLNSLDGTTFIPAVNVLTRKMKVQPFNFVDLSAGFRIQARNVEFEIGYDLWAHGNEQLKFNKPFPENKFGIAAMDANGNPIYVPGSNVGATACQSTIAQMSAVDLDDNDQPTFVAIKELDLDLVSGSARAAVAHRAHIALGLVHDQCTFALFCGIGGYIEIPQNNSALKNWGFWGKVGGTF